MGYGGEAGVISEAKKWCSSTLKTVQRRWRQGLRDRTFHLPEPKGMAGEGRQGRAEAHSLSPCAFRR